MLGICGISFLVIFIQFYIIADLFQKINTFFIIFLKTFPIRPGFPPGGASSALHVSFQRSILCQGVKFCTRIWPIVKFTTLEKIGIWSDPVEIFYVNLQCISSFSHPCGKPLWKTLWRMWKSMSFQQVFVSFPLCPPDVENSAYASAYPAKNWLQLVLRQCSLPRLSGQKFVK